MQNIRTTLLATLIGSLAFVGMTKPVYAQKMFVDQTIEEAPIATSDAEIKKILPLVYSDSTTSDTTVSPDGGLFATLYVDNTPESTTQKVTGTDKTMPIASDDALGISTYFSKFHPGIDIRAQIGSSIHAILPGIVSEVSFEEGGYGRYVVIVHHVDGKTLFSLYAHMQEAVVKVGELVTSGEIIGEVGLTGHTTGPHLHFEIHTVDTAINPLTFFDGNTIAMATK